MPIRRHSLLLPCRRLDDFPTHLAGDLAAELLAGWTALWHPALIHATGSLPGWHSAAEPPDPAELDGELILIPSVSRQHLASDWCDRFGAANPSSPSPVDTLASRAQTVAAALSAAAIDTEKLSVELVSDFFALGHAHLQVELLTRAMRYTSVLDTEQFTMAVLAAASATVAGYDNVAREEIARAFDLLADARNHVYAVDFYIVDVTLLAASTLGDVLRAKLAAGSPTSLLTTGELMDEMARDHPETLAELRRAIEAGTACVVGGMYRGEQSEFASCETILSELHAGQEICRGHLGREFEVFGQFSATFSPLLPEILTGMGFRGALHATFDGGRLPRANQCKTWWGKRGGPSIEALAAAPLDAGQPETWLKLAERIGDTIAHDHVATILLAGWPGAESEFYSDLVRAARYGPVLGKLVTLEQYFRDSRQPDDWTFLEPREYSSRFTADAAPNPISTRVDAHLRDALATHQQLCAGLTSIVTSTEPQGTAKDAPCKIVLNPWSFSGSRFVGINPLDFESTTGSAEALLLSDIPGCGFAKLDAAEGVSSVSLVDGLVLRNERLALTVSESTGGIQSLRTHRDRCTRMSQRLAFEGGSRSMDDESQMIADRIEITRNDAWIGEIVSHGRLLNSKGEHLAGHRQSMRVVRGLPAVLVEVHLEPEQMPEGDAWNSYYASRIAWADEEATLRCGQQWIGRETSRQNIESLEWVEVDGGVGTITCFGLGLAFHRLVGPSRLDTLLVVQGEHCRHFQFALALDEAFPTHAALSLLTAGQLCETTVPGPVNMPRGWFLHVGAKNVAITHIDLLPAPAGGIRVRLLETEGRDAHTTLTAFQPFRSARATDFRGNSTGVLSVVEGRVRFDLGAHRWIQIEAEW